MKFVSEKWKIVAGILLFALEVRFCHGNEMMGSRDSQLNFKDDPGLISFPSAARTSTTSKKISASRPTKLKNPPPPMSNHPHLPVTGNDTQIESKVNSTKSSTKNISKKHSPKQTKLSSSQAFQVLNTKSLQATPNIFAINIPNQVMSEAIRKTPTSKLNQSSKKPFIPSSNQTKKAKNITRGLSTIVQEGFSKMFASRSVSESARTLLLAAPLLFAEAMTLGGVGLAAPALFLAPLLLIPLVLVTFIIFI